MPRRGEERLVAGRLWTSRNRQGPVSRLSFLSGDAGRERRLLVQNGPRSAAWTWTSRGDDAVSPVGLAGLFEPIGETELTAFDLQMPYIYWDDFVFEGVINLRGRPAHVFLVYPPAEIVAQRPALTGVRLYLDTAYHALVQSEQIGEGGLLLRSMTLNDLKQVDDQWIAKSIDFRNEATRDKSRFQVTGAALGLRFPEEHFAPSALAEPIAAPPGERVRIVGR